MGIGRKNSTTPAIRATATPIAIITPTVDNASTMKDTIATIAPPKNENIVPMIPMIAEITVIANPATAIKPATPATTATITAKIKNMAHQWIKKLAPDLMICDLDRSTYQNLLNQDAAYLLDFC